MATGTPMTSFPVADWFETLYDVGVRDAKLNSDSVEKAILGVYPVWTSIQVAFPLRSHPFPANFAKFARLLRLNLGDPD